MTLRIVPTARPELVSAPVIAQLREALDAHGRATLLVPTFSQATEAQRQLAQEGLSLGVGTTTPAAWAKERWEVHGSGARAVDGTARQALVSCVLYDWQQANPDGPAFSRGYERALVRFVSDALAWLPLDWDDKLDLHDPRIESLSPGELQFAFQAAAYGRELANRGLVEPCQAMCALPERLREVGATTPPIVAAGFASLPYATSYLLANIAAFAQVSVVFQQDGSAAGAYARTFADRLEQLAVQAGAQVERQDVPDEALVASTELEQLSAALYRTGGTASVVRPEGHVELLEAAGPLAEAELVACAVCELPEGCTDIVVCAPDADGAWRELAPKLAARGCLVQGMRRQNVGSLGTCRALKGFADMLARLAELEWPDPADAEASATGLGDMSWWPPREITDFLLTDAARVAPMRAWALDARFRGNRVLSPQAVFDALQRASNTSPGVAQATGALLQGRLAQSASLLLTAGMDEESAPVSQESVAVLSAYGAAARTLFELGVLATCDRRTSPYSRERRVPLSRLVELVGQIMDQTVFMSRRQLGPKDAPRVVRLCSREEAAALAPRSADALIAMGLTSAESPLSPEEGAVLRLEEQLGCDSARDPLDAERKRFARIVALPRERLLLEHALVQQDGRPAYPAVALTELLSCYGTTPDDAREVLAVTSRGEGTIGENGSARGQAQAGESLVTLSAAGQVSERSRSLVSVPRDGETELRHGLPSLSASQIESYLECPYKWFTLRRLGLEGVDAGFSGMEMGTFAHFVLERTYSRLLERAMRELGVLEEGQEFDQLATSAPVVPGSAVGHDTLEFAHQALTEEFHAHLEQQWARARARKDQSLVPHSASERYQLVMLERQLHSVLDWDQGVLLGLSPRWFELRFGGRSAEQEVTYAGVDFVGTIDRVDVAPDGRAVIVDYKHKSPYGFANEYDVFPAGGCSRIAEFQLPRRVQSLVYAQILRRMRPDLDVRGAVYVATRALGNNHVVAGVVEGDLATAVLGNSITKGRLERFEAGGDGIAFLDLLDAAEERIAQAIDRMREGHIEANPRDKEACNWCPAAASCERRLV